MGEKPDWNRLAPYFDKVENYYNQTVAPSPANAEAVKRSVDALRNRLSTYGIDTTDDATLFVIACTVLEYASVTVTELSLNCAGEPRDHALLHAGSAATAFGYLLRGLRMTREQIADEEAFLAHVAELLKGTD